MGALLAFDRVSKTYGEGGGMVRALHGVDLSIERGEFVAIMGPSGSGKSTAMNILGCLDSPTEGKFLFNDVDVTKLPRDGRALLRRHFLGFVFQGYNLLNRTTAIENVELPLIYRGTAKARAPRAGGGGLASRWPERPRTPHAFGAFRRAAAARGHCAGHCHGSSGAAGGRAHGQS